MRKTVIVCTLAIVVLVFACYSCSSAHTIAGAYDTSIVGYVSPNAYVKFDAKSVYLIDGLHSTSSFGSLRVTNGVTTWITPSGTSWYITKSSRGLLCVEVASSSNQFLLKQMHFPEVQVRARVAWDRMLEYLQIGSD